LCNMLHASHINIFCWSSGVLHTPCVSACSSAKWHPWSSSIQGPKWLRFGSTQDCQTCWCWWQLLWDLNIIYVAFELQYFNIGIYVTVFLTT
jgi:hypothetical protein